MDINKWKRAVIHLECVTDSIDILDRIDGLRKALGEGRITQEEFNKEFMVSVPTRDIQKYGTAIFYTNDGKYYLITARHVIYDKISATRELNKRKNTFHHMEEEEFLNKIFNVIFRVPSLEEACLNRSKEFLMCLAAGPTYMQPYTFSDPSRDLAIISLIRDEKFVEDLLANGYVPITETELGDEPNIEGQDIFTVGFPAATSTIGKQVKSTAELNWEAKIYSLPVCSFGKVAMTNTNLEYFWTDLSIYPGNSGGPIIFEDKLIGIVSKQAYTKIDNANEEFRVRIPFGMIIKAKYIKDLLKIQNEKDEAAKR